MFDLFAGIKSELTSSIEVNCSQRQLTFVLDGSLNKKN